MDADACLGYYGPMSDTIREYFSSLRAALGAKSESSERIRYIKAYAAAHVLKGEYLTKVEINAKKLLWLYLLKEEDPGFIKNKTAGPLVYALVYLAELGMEGKFDRDFVMYSSGCSRPFLYKYVNSSLAVLDKYNQKKQRKPRWDVQYGSEITDAKELVSRLLSA